MSVGRWVVVIGIVAASALLVGSALLLLGAAAGSISWFGSGADPQAISLQGAMGVVGAALVAVGLGLGAFATGCAWARAHGVRWTDPERTRRR